MKKFRFTYEVPIGHRYKTASGDLEARDDSHAKIKVENIIYEKYSFGAKRQAIIDSVQIKETEI